MKHPQKMRRLNERRVKELRRLKHAERVAREENEDPRDVAYDMTGEWEPVKSHEWDEF
jgi:hypothetical protein